MLSALPPALLALVTLAIQPSAALPAQAGSKHSHDLSASTIDPTLLTAGTRTCSTSSIASIFGRSSTALAAALDFCSVYVAPTVTLTTTVTVDATPTAGPAGRHARFQPAPPAPTKPAVPRAAKHIPVEAVASACKCLVAGDDLAALPTQTLVATSTVVRSDPAATAAPDGASSDADLRRRAAMPFGSGAIRVREVDQERGFAADVNLWRKDDAWSRDTFHAGRRTT